MDKINKNKEMFNFSKREMCRIIIAVIFAISIVVSSWFYFQAHRYKNINGTILDQKNGKLYYRDGKLKGEIFYNAIDKQKNSKSVIDEILALFDEYKEKTKKQQVNKPFTDKDDKLKKLYNNMLKSGRITDVELGDYDIFKTNIADTAKARKFYNRLITDKTFTEEELGDWGSFSGNLDEYFK